MNVRTIGRHQIECGLAALAGLGLFVGAGVGHAWGETGDPARALPNDLEAEDCPTYEQVSDFPRDSSSPSEEAPLSCPKPETCPPGQEGGGCGGGGMPVWRVLEPSLNLVVRDIPLFYTMSDGRQLPFVLRYRQRGPVAPTNIFGVGNGWECSWRVYGVARSGGFSLHTGSGSQRKFKDFLEYFLDTYGARATTASGLEWELAYRSWCKNQLTTQVSGGGGVTNNLLSAMYDPHGRAIRFQYETNQGIIRLARVIDYDGKTNLLSYTDSNFPQFVTSVQDPYGRTTILDYEVNGDLASIQDMQGMVSSFQYSQGLLTQMTTPYGITTFQARTNETYTNTPISRALLVKLPSGGTNLFIYRDRTDGLTNEFAGGGYMERRNTFFWNSRQMEQLDTSWTNLMLLPDAPATDFLKGRLRHWETDSSSGVAYLTSQLLAERQPSPDGETAGHTVRFTYPSSYPAAWPSTMSETLPTGEERHVDYVRNEWGLPTSVTTSIFGDWSTDARTVEYTYDSSDTRLLLEARGPESDEFGALLVERSYQYGANNLLTQITSALGSIQCTYSTNPSLTSVTYPWGLVVTNRFDINGWLTDRVWQTTGGTALASIQVTWDRGKVATLTDVRGLTATNFWDGLGRPTGRAYPDQTTVSNVYARLDRVRFKDRLGRWTSFEYDSRGLLTAVTNALTNVTRYQWCDCGYLENITDALTNVTSLAHDLQGRLTNVVYPGAGQLNIGWDALGQPAYVADVSGWAAFTFNPWGMLSTVSNTFGVWRQVDYDVKDRPTNVVFASGLHLANTYDALGRLVSRRELSTNAVESFGYAAGIPWLTAYTNQLGTNVALLSYDALGRVTRRAFGSVSGGNFIESTTNGFTYNGAGDLLTLADGKGQTTTWVYDPYGRALQKTYPGGVQGWTNGYNANGWLTGHWTPAKGLVNYVYDEVGNLKTIDYPTSTDVVLGYDAKNRLITMTDAVGTSAFGWTAFGALASEDGPWASDIVNYTYNEARRREALALEQPNATPWSQNYAYDASWRLTDIISPAGAFAYDYATPAGPSAADLVCRMGLPNGSYITNSYDDLGRLTSTVLKDSSGTVLNSHAYGYSLANLRMGATNTSGNRWEYAYDALGQLLSAKGKESDGSLRSHEQLTYGYDRAGNLYGRTNNALAQGFANNALNQPYAGYRSGTLTVAGLTTPSVTTVKVKANGDAGVDVIPYADKAFARTGVSLIDGANTFSAEAQGSLGRKSTNTVSVSLPVSVTYQHDGNGNLISDGRRFFTYDDENQLSSVIVTNGPGSSTLTTNLYDGLGRRRVRREYQWSGSAWLQTAEVRYLYDHRLAIQERDASNLPQVTYTRGRDLSGGLQRAGGIGGLLAMTRHGALAPEHHYYHRDGNGNVTALVDAGQRITARYAYEPFGNLLGMSGWMAEANPYRFSSKEWQANGSLYYYGFRFYEPNLQRWVNRDPLGERGGINLYGYVGNSPINYFDPLGLAWFDDLAEWAQGQHQEFVEAMLATSGDGNGWFTVGAWNTISELTAGAFSYPQGMSQLGTGSGTYAGDPTLENAAGAALDVAMAADVLAGCSAPLAGANKSLLKPKPCPPKIYRGGRYNESAIKDIRVDPDGVSFRDSLSNPLPKPGEVPQPVLRPGKPYIEVDTSKLPPGSVIVDNVPPGHVSVKATAEEIVNAISGGGKFPAK